jgi:hypothetical protein
MRTEYQADDNDSSITPSKLLVLGVFIGCLASAGFVLFLLLAGSPSPSKTKAASSEKQAGVIPGAVEIIQAAEGGAQTQLKGRGNKPQADRTRNAPKAANRSDYRKAIVETAPGKSPKMIESP